MRTITVDFTNANPTGGVETAGYIGEHNATQIVITPPAEMTAEKSITNYAVAFEVGGAVCRSEIFPKAATIALPLWAQVTRCETATMQLEGYDNDNALVIKSKTICLMFAPSVAGENTRHDENSRNIAATIAKMQVKSRYYANDRVGGVVLAEWRDDYTDVSFEALDNLLPDSAVVLDIIVRHSIDENDAEYVDIPIREGPYYTQLYGFCTKFIDEESKIVFMNSFAAASAKEFCENGVARCYCKIYQSDNFNDELIFQVAHGYRAVRGFTVKYLEGVI